MANYRVGRVRQEIMREVNRILLREAKDPRIEGVTITDVDLTGDLQWITAIVLINYLTKFINKIKQNKPKRLGQPSLFFHAPKCDQVSTSMRRATCLTNLFNL